MIIDIVPFTIRISPTANSQQAQIIPSATLANDGVMTKEQVQQLNSLTPVVDDIYFCPVWVSINDAVFLSAANTVDQATATDPSLQPVIGFVTSKPTPTTCVVIMAGALPGFVGLISGATYFLSIAPGSISTVAPSVVGQFVQRIGFARNPTTLIVEVDRDFTVL